MKISMITIGSTGDVRPYILLGRELKKRGYDISICAFMNFEDLAKKEGFGFIPIKRDVEEYMYNILSNNSGGIDYVNNMKKELKLLAPLLLEAVDKAVQEADLVISTYFGSFSRRIAEKYNKLYVQTHFFPMDINDVSPIAAAKGFALGKNYYHFTYKLGYIVINMLEKFFTSKVADDYEIEPNEIKSAPIYTINGKKFPVIYAISRYVLPPYSEWDDNIYVTGYFFDKENHNYTPSKELVEFLNSGDKPIYIGFGSMVSDKVEKYLSITLEAVSRLNIRVVLSQGWKDFVAPQNENIFTIGSIPHDYIFQHVKAVVHHGGAGTFAAGLKYGKPTYIVPFGGDQSFNCLRAYELGIGPKPLKQEFFNADKMERCLKDLVENEEYKKNAEQLSYKINQEHGLDEAVNIIEEYINANKA